MFNIAHFPILLLLLCAFALGSHTRTDAQPLWQAIGPYKQIYLPTQMVAQGDRINILFGSTKLSTSFNNGQTWTTWDAAVYWFEYWFGGYGVNEAYPTSLTSNNNRLFARATEESSLGGVYIQNVLGYHTWSQWEFSGWMPQNDPVFIDTLALVRAIKSNNASPINNNPAKQFLFRSFDNGSTWSTVATVGLPDNVQSFAAGKRSFFAFTTQGMLRSQDSGTSWKPFALRSGLLRLFFVHGSLYATGDNCWRSDDDGNTWAKISSPIANKASATAFYAGSPATQRVFAASGTGLFASEDSGATWTLLSELGFADEVQETSTGGLFIRVGGSRMSSDDGGKTWTTIKPIPEFYYMVPSMASEGAASSPIYALSNTQYYTFCPVGETPTATMLRSDDNGDSWVQLGRTDAIGGTAVSNTSNVFIATAFKGIQRSTDKGQSWANAGMQQTTTASQTPYISRIVANKTTLFALRASRPWYRETTNTVLRSDDEGKTWNDISSGLPALNTLVYSNALFNAFAVNDSFVFVANDTALYRINTSGGKWQKILDVQQAKQYYYYQPSLVVRNSEVLCGSGRTLSYSGDNGTTWKNIGEQLAGTLNGDISALAFDGTSIAVATGGTVVLSKNRGATWKSMNPGLEGVKDVNSLLMHNGYLYAQTASQGVYRTTVPLTLVSVRQPEREQEQSAIFVTVSPNPFYEQTMLRLTLQTPHYVVMRIYTMLGEEVATLHNEWTTAGTHEIHWKSKDAPQGMYWYSVQAGDGFTTGNLMVVR